MSHLDPHNGGPDTLLLLSGGVDSVWALWKHLTTTSEPIRTHHVHLINWEGRTRFEAHAVKKVLAWARKNGFGNRIIHSESTTDVGNLKWIPRDHHTWGFWAGFILADPSNAGITKVIRTFHIDSVEGGVDSPTRHRADEAWRRPIEFMARRPVELVWPMIGLTKADVVRDLPAELLELCWWCRRPRAGRPCHACHTCRQVDAALGRQVQVQREEAPIMGEGTDRVALVARQSFNGLEGPVRRGRRFYASPDRAHYLVTHGLAAHAPRLPGPSETAVDAGPAEFKPAVRPEPVHTGGGWYDVAGQRVQGKAAAEAAADAAYEAMVEPPAGHTGEV